nr:MAG TPA: hypothetical protein [Caudoviricetes sp.]
MALPLYGYNPYQFGQVNPLQPQMDRLANMQAQYQQPQQQNVNQGILWVQGEAGAKSYLVAPNTSVLLMDSDESAFYLKSADSSGMPSLRTFKYIETTNQPKENLKSNNNADIDFVPKKEFEEFKSEILKRINETEEKSHISMDEQE